MEDVFERFSCKSWILLPVGCVSEFVENSSLIKVRDDLTWKNVLEVEETQINLLVDEKTLILSSPSNGYVIVEGAYLEKKGSNISKEISIDRNDFVFNMSIDIWVPYMFVEFFYKGKLIRRIEYSLNEEKNNIDISVVGEKTKWEDLINYLPESPIGYDDFFYPLYFMNSLGIDMVELEILFNKRALVFKLGNVADG